MPSAKAKTFLKQAKGKKSKQQVLEDADDYLAAATDIEDGVGKHRGGDPAKSLRFAHRALDLYSQGLSRFPNNFDLAYNKARLELEIATHPVLVRHLEVPVDNVLQQALESHRYALRIDSENADLLFNMAQLLTTISERIARDENTSDMEAIRYLEEALRYQNACLDFQLQKFNESRHPIVDIAFDEEDDDGGAKLDASMANPESAKTFAQAEPDEQWFSVVEPITTDTLIDTILAQLGTLTTLCSIVNASLSFSSENLTDAVNPAQIEAYSIKILNDSLPSIVRSGAEELNPREAEIELAKANYLATFLELTFRSGSISAQSYRETLLKIFSPPALTNDPSALTAYARSLIAFNTAVLDTSLQNATLSPAGQSDHTAVRWTSLSEAQTVLTTAAKLATGDSSAVATTHALRGDSSLLLLSLSEPPFHHPQATSNRLQLLKNAEVFYRNATKLYNILGDEWKDDAHIYQFRMAVVQVLQQMETNISMNGLRQSSADIRSIPWTSSIPYGALWVREQVGEMIDDGLVTRDSFVLP